MLDELYSFIQKAKEVLRMDSGSSVEDICAETLRSLEQPPLPNQAAGMDTETVDELLKVLNIENEREIVPTVQNLVAYANNSS